MEEQERICPNCLKKMEKLPAQPTYACAWCGRIETEDGTVMNPGRKI